MTRKKIPGKTKLKKPREKQHEYVSLEVKNKLIEMVLENGITAFRASKVLDIRPCTAKRIIRKHMQATENQKNGKTRAQPLKTDKVQRKPNRVTNQAQMLTHTLSSNVNSGHLAQAGSDNFIYPFWNNYMGFLQMLHWSNQAALQARSF